MRLGSTYQGKNTLYTKSRMCIARPQSLWGLVIFREDWLETPTLPRYDEYVTIKSKNI